MTKPERNSLNKIYQFPFVQGFTQGSCQNQSKNFIATALALLLQFQHNLLT